MMTTTLRLMDSATAAFASQFKLHSVLSLSLTPLSFACALGQSIVRSVHFGSVRFPRLSLLALPRHCALPRRPIPVTAVCGCMCVFVLGLRYKSIIIKSFCCFISSATMLRSSGSAQVPWQHVALLINIASVFN